MNIVSNQNEMKPNKVFTLLCPEVCVELEEEACKISGWFMKNCRRNYAHKVSIDDLWKTVGGVVHTMYLLSKRAGKPNTMSSRFSSKRRETIIFNEIMSQFIFISWQTVSYLPLWNTYFYEFEDDHWFLEMVSIPIRQLRKSLSSNFVTLPITSHVSKTWVITILFIRIHRV